MSDTRQAILDGLFAAIDDRDTDRFLDHLAADVEFRFASSPPARGREAVAQAVGGFFASIADLRHELCRVMEHDTTLVCEGEVTYTRRDGSTITMPFANILEFVGDRISDYRVYTDISSLYNA